MGIPTTEPLNAPAAAPEAEPASDEVEPLRRCCPARKLHTNAVSAKMHSANRRQTTQSIKQPAQGKQQQHEQHSHGHTPATFGTQTHNTPIVARASRAHNGSTRSKQTRRTWCERRRHRAPQPPHLRLHTSMHKRGTTQGNRSSQSRKRCRRQEEDLANSAGKRNAAETRWGTQAATQPE